MSEQKIMVYCGFHESDYYAIAHGIRISEIFQLQLCLFHSLETTALKSDAQLRLSAMIKRVKLTNPDISIASLCLKGTLADTIGRVTDGFDGIMMICSTMDLKFKVKALQQSRIPFLFVGKWEEDFLNYKHIILPMDYRKVMKSSALWGTYFARFNQSNIELLSANEKDGENKRKLELNVQAFEKIMNGFGLKYKRTQAVKSSFTLPKEALVKAKKQKSDLLIIPASQKVTLIDLWIGLPEMRLIKQAEGVPIMCINPTHDMLVLCD